MSLPTQFTNEELPVAMVYAQAAWNLAKRDGGADSFLEEYRGFVAELLDKDPSIEKFLRAMTVGRDKRQAVLEKSFKGKVSDLLYNFLVTLNRHDRLGIVRTCGIALEEIANKENNIVLVEVRSAVPLKESQQSDLETMVRQRFNVEPRLSVTVDPTILGGLWVRVGDTVLDLTLKTNVRKLRDAMRTRNSYEIQSGRSYFDSPSGN